MFSLISYLRRREGVETADATAALFGTRTAGVPTFRDSLPRLAAELRRARRYERPLTILALEPDCTEAIQREQRRTGGSILHPPSSEFATHLIFFLLGSLLRDALRETDIVTYSAEHHLYVVLLPETGDVEAQHAIGRISGVIYDRAGIRLRAGIAEFPRGGLTVDDLFDNARHARKGQVQVGQVPIVREASNA